MCQLSICLGWAQIERITVDLPPVVVQVPQTYTLHAIKVGRTNHDTLLQSATWFYELGNTSTNLTSICDGTLLESGYSCTVGKGVLLPDSSDTYDFNLTVTWNGEGGVNNGILGQSSNGDHVYRFHLRFGLEIYEPVTRNRYFTLTGKLTETK